jgi:hypothetical protein
VPSGELLASLPSVLGSFFGILGSSFVQRTRWFVLGSSFGIFGSSFSVSLCRGGELHSSFGVFGSVGARAGHTRSDDDPDQCTSPERSA